MNPSLENRVYVVGMSVVFMKRGSDRIRTSKQTLVMYNIINIYNHSCNSLAQFE
jgi:hypothetical protein